MGALLLKELLLLAKGPPALGAQKGPLPGVNYLLPQAHLPKALLLLGSPGGWMWAPEGLVSLGLAAGSALQKLVA